MVPFVLFCFTDPYLPKLLVTVSEIWIFPSDPSGSLFWLRIPSLYGTGATWIPSTVQVYRTLSNSLVLSLGSRRSHCVPRVFFSLQFPFFFPWNRTPCFVYDFTTPWYQGSLRNLKRKTRLVFRGRRVTVRERFPIRGTQTPKVRSRCSSEVFVRDTWEFWLVFSWCRGQGWGPGYDLKSSDKGIKTSSILSVYLLLHVRKHQVDLSLVLDWVPPANLPESEAGRTTTLVECVEDTGVPCLLCNRYSS